MTRVSNLWLSVCISNDPIDQGNSAYFTVDGKMFVSTFEGTDNVNDWPSIRSSVSGGLYFCPDWTSLGPTSNFNLDLVDCAFSWNMWPDGPNDVSTEADDDWDADFLAPAGKSYMMGLCDLQNARVYRLIKDGRSLTLVQHRSARLSQSLGLARRQ